LIFFYGFFLRFLSFWTPHWELLECACNEFEGNFQ